MPRTFPLPSTLASPPRGPSPIAFAGDHLGQLRGNDLIVRRTSDWSAVTHVPLGNPAGIGGLADGSLVALDSTDRMGRASLLIRLPPLSGRPSLHDGLVPETGPLHIHALPSAGELACTQPGGDRVYRLKLVGGRMELLAAVRVRSERCRIMTSLADGSFVYSGGSRELVRAAFGSLPRRYAISIEPRTLMPGPRPDTLWVSGDDLQLVSLAEPMRPLARRPVVPEQYDIASCGGHVAALLLDRAAASPERRWTLVCYDLRATELWRRPVAAAPSERPGERFPARWVACSTRHIAVGGHDDIDVFDARTGALLHSS